MTIRNRGVTRGFTLIELMVTIALVAFLLTIGIPLAREWVLSAHQRDSAGKLTEALGRAKALALRNQQGLTDQSLPTAAVCLSGQQLSVVGADTNKQVTCANQADWTAQISSDASVVRTATNIPFQCAAYNERGVLLSVSLASLACTPPPLPSASSSPPSQSSVQGQVTYLDVNVSSEEALHVFLP
ncbi:prepilin-type N-terminal cleavage/methylation domain-containing protein [Dyella sp.]|uniref:type IV pilin protein n=1 Tax=Dyella sp. TaxID=1869338 RepID=UPI002B462A51|nr:prepilin-type N-terminal cleavage/methylation domain-containing protein [Dyella sp.]HKT26595.1 prepilin-type N-terminal cleavage/methylation domain-containing protein [Dyella sp.]